MPAVTRRLHQLPDCIVVIRHCRLRGIGARLSAVGVILTHAHHHKVWETLVSVVAVVVVLVLLKFAQKNSHVIRISLPRTAVVFCHMADQPDCAGSCFHHAAGAGASRVCTIGPVGEAFALHHIPQMPGRRHVSARRRGIAAARIAGQPEAFVEVCRECSFRMRLLAQVKLVRFDELSVPLKNSDKSDFPAAAGFHRRIGYRLAASAACHRTCKRSCAFPRSPPARKRRRV